MGLTRGQLAVLHVAKEQLGLEEEAYRDVLQSAAGVRSATKLDDGTFQRVMERFEELGFSGSSRYVRRPRSRAAGEPNAGAMVTGAQLSYMRRLFDRLGMDSLVRQNAFVRKLLPKNAAGWPQTRREASKVIETLKKMAERGYDAGPRTT